MFVGYDIGKGAKNSKEKDDLKFADVSILHTVHRFVTKMSHLVVPTKLISSKYTVTFEYSIIEIA